MNIAIGIISVVLLLVVFFFFKLLKAQKENHQKELEQIKNSLEEQVQTNKQIEIENNNLQVQLSQKEILLNEREKNIADVKTEKETIKCQLDNIRQEKESLTAKYESKCSEYNLLQEQMSNEAKTQKEKFEKHLELVQAQLKNTTQELLNQKEQQLSDSNKEQMGTIINPLKETIAEMKKTMEASREAHTKEAISLETHIKTIMERSLEIGRSADNLAKALKNDNPKMQGNWGELVLKELLESQGLVEGKHFDTQVTLKDEEEKRMIPDVILHYPDGKDAIIDSKVSLTAFVDYQNATNEEEANNALQRHLTSVKGHIDELYKKNYSNYLKSKPFIDFVIMFIPNEMALQLALYSDNSLWRTAFNKGVFLTSEQNLVALLRMIELAWTQVEQNNNQKAIIDEAEKLVARIGDFLSKFDDIKDNLGKLSRTFDDAEKKLHTGQQSILGSANRLINLGIKQNAKKPILQKEEYNISQIEENL